MKISFNAFRCHVTRVSSGSRYVLDQAEDDVHFILESLPGVFLPAKFHRFVKTAIISFSVILFFVAPWTGFLFSIYWGQASWRNGTCKHCAAGSEEKADA